MKTYSFTELKNNVDMWNVKNANGLFPAFRKEEISLKTYASKLSTKNMTDAVNSVVTVLNWDMNDLFSHVDNLPRFTKYTVKLTEENGVFMLKVETENVLVPFIKCYERIEQANGKTLIDWRMIGLNILYNIQFAGEYENTPATMSMKEIKENLGKVHYTSGKMVRTMAECLVPRYDVDELNKGKVFMDLTDTQVITAYIQAIRISDAERATFVKKDKEDKKTENKKK